MNYRHVFHAGNFADCMKHALVLALMRMLTEKPAPLFVLDTHAGTGQYDLASDAAARTKEAAGGIARLLDDTPPALADYVGTVRALGFDPPAGRLYPGSPMLVQALLRDGDQMACCELHPEDHARLRGRFRGDPRIAVHKRDAWEGLKALLPPKQKRGLVLIDPPFEDPSEFTRLRDGLGLAETRFRTAVLAAWYPIKHRAPVRAFLDGLTTRDTIACELLLRAPLDPARLNGCGLVVVNAPWRFQERAQAILDALYDRLGEPGAGGGAMITRVTDE
jgi:23S rRNA (adenine2030-N6)-methyltransferase